MRITAKGLAKTQDDLAKMAERVRDLSPAMEAGAQDIRTLIDDSFRQSREPDGTPWKPLAESTLRRRKGYSPTAPKETLAKQTSRTRRKQSFWKRLLKKWARKFGLGSSRRKRAPTAPKVPKTVFVAKPLIDSGTLRNSIALASGMRSIQFGTNVPYAGIHQLGASNAGRSRKATIPSRPFLPVEKVGGKYELVERGPSAKTTNRIRSRIKNFILTGKPTSR